MRAWHDAVPTIPRLAVRGCAQPWLITCSNPRCSGAPFSQKAVSGRAPKTIDSSGEVHPQPAGAAAAAATAAALLWKDMQMGGTTFAMERMHEGMVHRPSPAINPDAAAGTCAAQLHSPPGRVTCLACSRRHRLRTCLLVSRRCRVKNSSMRAGFRRGPRYNKSHSALCCSFCTPMLQIGVMPTLLTRDIAYRPCRPEGNPRGLAQ